jgi:hypothetical protein
MPMWTGLLQRKCACGGSSGLTGECAKCANKRLQRSSRGSSGKGTEYEEKVPSIVHETLRSSGQPLDAETRSFMESRFGHDFSQVRIHTDAQAAKSARAVNALAYTVGQDVVFAAGQYAPGTRTGDRLLTHELAHVVQQSGRPVPVGMPQVSAMTSLNHPLEREATASADRIAAGSQALVSSGHSAENLQRQEADSGGAPQKDPCEKLESDRESFCIMVIRHFVRTRINPLFDELAESVTCPTPRYCEVVYPSGLTASVLFTPAINRLAVGARRGDDVTSCALEYSCDQNGQLSFKVLLCDGQKPP